MQGMYDGRPDRALGDFTGKSAGTGRMKINLCADYSLRLLVYLAAPPGQLPSIRRIAGDLGVSHNHLSKIAHDLRKPGYIDAVCGRSGGLRLARLAGDITLGDVVRHTEKFPGPSPSVPAQLTGMFDKAFEAYVEALDSYRLAELVAEKAAAQELSDDATPAARESPPPGR
jgi:Rrf2 family nitric oxide-sensitive transcriptional repressor